MNETKLIKSQTLQDALFDILENDYVLRDKQHEAFSAMADKELIEISNGYFRLPTAFGKTVMFSLMARAFLDNSNKKNKIVILVPRLTLVWQTLEKLQQFANTKGSVYIGPEKDISADIIVSTYQSADRLFKELKSKKQDVGLIIADEAHHAIGEQTSKIMQSVATDTPVVGFTATPTFSEEHALGDLLSTELYTLSIEDCVKEGLLCPVKNVLYRPSVNFDILNAPITRGEGSDYDYQKIGKMIKIQTLMDEISQLYVNHGDENRKFRDMRAIINCPSREIAEKQAEKLNELAGRDIAIAVHSNQKDFDKRVKAFLSKKFQVVCQVNTLTEGLDDPSIELCINYPSHSPVKIEQTGGRVLRPDDKNPNKFAYVLDTVFRVSPDEPLEASLQRAFIAGQVLYRDVAGEFVVKPEEQGQKHDKSAKTDKDKKNKSKEDFDVITDETLLTRLNPKYKKWQQDDFWLSQGYVPRVDELHDMSPKYLAKKLFNPKTMSRVKPVEMLAKMKWLRQSMPYAIKIKMTVNNRRCLFLRDVFYDAFVKNSGFEEIETKSKRDMDAADISELYRIDKQQANLRIIKLAKQINAKHKIDGKTGRLILCFDKKYLKKVCQGLNLRQERVEKPEDDYISVEELSKQYIDADKVEIRGVLADIYLGEKSGVSKDLKDAITHNHRYRLHKDFIDEFCKVAGFDKKEQKERSKNSRRHRSLYPRPAAVWKSEKKLMNNYIDADIDSKLLHEQLERFAKKHPYAIKLGNDYASFLFNLAYLPELCEFIGVTYIPLPFKTDKWKSASELKFDYIDASVENIKKALKKYSGYESWVDNSIVVVMNTDTDVPELCLNVNKIDDFIKVSGLPSKKKQNAMKHGTEMVETLIQINSTNSKINKPKNRIR